MKKRRIDEMIIVIEKKEWICCSWGRQKILRGITFSGEFDKYDF
jgi:hypothetical protein